MKKISLQLLVLFLLSMTLFAQNKEQKDKLVDEFGNVTLEDMIARLEVFPTAFKDNPKAKGLVRIHGGARTIFAYPYLRGAVIKAYLKNNLRLPSDKFSVQFCDVNNGPIQTRLFILEENEQIEPCEENLIVPEKTVLFENLYFYDNAVFSSEKPLEEYFFDVAGPREREYSRTSQNVLLNLLNKSPESKIYLVGYVGTNLYLDGETQEEVRKLDKLKALNKIFRQIEKEFIRSGIDASRIIKVNGGYLDSHKSVGIWFVPKGGEIPEPKPDFFPKKKR